MTVADDLAALRGLITDHSPDGYDQVDLGWTWGLRRNGLEALDRVEAEIVRLEEQRLTDAVLIAGLKARVEKAERYGEQDEAEIARLARERDEHRASLADEMGLTEQQRARAEAAEAERDRWRERTGEAKAREEALRVEAARLRDGLGTTTSALEAIKRDNYLLDRGDTWEALAVRHITCAKVALRALLGEDGAACGHGITLQNRETGVERCAECGAVVAEDGAA